MVKEIVGLTSEEVKRSGEIHGKNILEKEKTKGFFIRFFENLNDPIIKVLIIALSVEVIFTFGHTNFIEVLGIVAAILLSTTVSTVSEIGSERAFLRMQAENLFGKARVLRNGNVEEISSSELVVGDVIYLSSGEKIAADGKIISGKISVDQSALNGESKETSKYFSRASEKFELSNSAKVFSGSVITSGNAIMEAERVGVNTFYGMIAKDVQRETRKSPLKLRLATLAGQISKLGYIAAAIVGLAFLFNVFFVDNGFEISRVINSFKNFPFLFSALVGALTLMITVVVVAAPEGLPMMITVVLSANMRRMMKDGVLVKKLVGIETAGSLNILFTDKTGTLTTGRLQCDAFVSHDGEYKTLTALKKNSKLYELLLASSKYNTESIVTSSSKIIGGNGTDRAFLEFFKGEKFKSLSVSEKMPFSSEKKYSAVTFSDGLTLVKGAPELLIKKCSLSLDKNGNTVPISRKELEASLHRFASLGNRVVAVAYKTKGSENMIFLSLAVLKDKIRRGVKDAVIGVKRAGVQVVMLTGDGKDTASAIARESGIISGDSSEIVLTSGELSEFTDEQLKKILPRLRVLARALPQDKTRLVRLSQELELVVGMTGDGINDAPSLKLADVGFSMGSGTDIAKNAGDIVLLDDGFFSINRTILYGRTIFKSIRKFIIFQLVMNLAACGISLVGQIIGIDTPITIIQMLWVNIIMDTLGGLAFSGEPPLEYYMKEAPKRRNEPILSSDMIKHILLNGAYTLTLSILFLRLDFFRQMFRNSENDVVFMTAFYALFIFAGIFNSFTARSERMWIFSSISKNKPFIFIMALISVIQVIMIYYGGAVFRSSPLLPKELFTVIFLAATVIPFDMLRRIFTKTKGK